MKISAALAIAGLAVCTSATAQFDANSKKYELDIRSQPLDRALIDLAQQTGLQIALLTDTADSSGMVGPIGGSLTPLQALDALLSDRDLSYKIANDHTIAIVKADRLLAQNQDQPNNSATKNSAPPAATEPLSAAAGNQSIKLEEIIVTAQKRLERLQDVPVPVTAVSGSQLAEGNRSRLEDYYAQVPGFSLSTDTLGPMVSIRGITPAGFGNPTVGFMIDDVPTGASTSYGGGFLAPEVDPGDLDRIEVLRGPQGTLYGASSMGGLVKYVTTSPSTDRLSGRVQAGLSGVQHGDGLGYNVSAGINVPMSDSFAVLASGFRHRDPGYIENVRNGDKGINEATVTGGHLSTLWEPSSLFSLKLSAMLQRSSDTGSGLMAREPGFGDFQQDFLPHTNSLEKKFENYSATINANLGDINLVSVTGYAKTHLAALADITGCCGELTAEAFPTMNTVEDFQLDNRKFSSELRLTIPLSDTFEWLVGGFYTNETMPKNQDDWVATDDNTQPLGLFARFLIDTTYKEKAVFTDFTYHFTDRLDLQVGGRYSWIDQTFQSSDIGPFAELFEGGSPFTQTAQPGNATASTYLFTPRFKITPDVMLYGRFASGYRAGGVNPPALVLVNGAPAQFAPDKTLNYEVGIKGDLFDRLLQFDASVYHIDWKNIQIGLIDPQSSISFYTNGASAKSQGIELSVQASPANGLRLGGWVSWNNAVLTRDMPLPPEGAAFGLKGNRLPASSRLSGNASVDYEVLVGQYTASLGWTMTYVGERMGDFTETPERQVRPSYITHDLRAGTELNDWNVDLYFNNLTDKRGMVGGGIGTTNPTYFEYIRPRNVALSVGRKF